MTSPRILLLSTVLTATASLAQAQTCPVRSAALIDTMGVTTHQGWTGSAYTASNVLAGMRYLGIRHIRESIDTPDIVAKLATLGKQGMQFDLTQTINGDGSIDLAGDLSRMGTLQQASPGAIIGYEGPNEYNAHSYTVAGQSSLNNLAWGALVNSINFAAIKSNAMTLRVSYIAAATAGVGGAIPFIAGTADAGNQHDYGQNGEQLGLHLQAGIGVSRDSMAGGPVEVTETGAASIPASATTWGTAGSPALQATVVTNALLDAAADGADHTYLYDLLDNFQGSDLENNLGLFNFDGTPKPVADEIHNLTAALADKGSNAGSFQAFALPISFPNLPAGVRWRLVEKSDGTYDVILWNSAATLWANGAPATVPLSIVTADFGEAFSAINLYAVAVGATPLYRLGGGSNLTVALGRDPLVIELSGRLALASSTMLCATDLIRVRVSGDNWNGAALFTVAVDGKLTGTYAVTASHAAGQWQDVYIAGNWGNGPHDVAVSFINDAWGGSAATDRNFYADRLTYNGRASHVGGIALMGNGTTIFPTLN